MYLYPHDTGVVVACSRRVVQVAVLNGSLQCLSCSAVVSSGTEDPERRQTSGLKTDTNMNVRICICTHIHTCRYHSLPAALQSDGSAAR